MSSSLRRKYYDDWLRFSLWPSILLWIILATVFTLIHCQCPWPRTPIHVSLHSDCVCGYSNVRRLSVQCSPMANFSQLLEVLNSPSVQRLPIDLLYINNATGLSVLPKNAFKKLDIQQIHLANTYLERIDKDAFAGLENRLNSLTLQNTGLKEIPAPIKTLKSLKTLDLSSNRIRKIRPRAFEELNQLSTLRLAFNHDLHLDVESFVGLGRTLKNLNIKGINLKHIPEAILNLTELAFLDLAQNKIEEIKPRMFRNHHLLTALSLERNLIRSMHPDTFVGLNDSLSSLSLLNNMLIEFPLLALSKLTGLRVLDLGFNAIRQLPDQAFRSNELLTLLALDGNPLKTLSLQTFKHLNNSLRGLSVGGKFFECDCKVRWLAEWAREYSLQITSRERNPQFCSRPQHLRNKLFTFIDLDDFVCPPLIPNNHLSSKSSITIIPTTTTTTTTTSTTTKAIPTSFTSSSTTKPSTITSTMKKTTPLATTTLKSTMITTTANENTSSTESLSKAVTSYVQVVPMINEEKIEPFSTTARTTIIKPALTSTFNRQNIPKIDNKSWQIPTSTVRSSSSHHQHHSVGPATLKLTDANYRNGSIHLRWETLKPSILGYQVLHRYFGSKEFYRSELLIPLTNSYTIDKHVKQNELIIVCVVNLDSNDPELINYDEEGENIIPNGQCRELSTREPIVKKTMPTRTGSATSTTTSLSSFYPTLKRLNDIDKIVIGISAAVCLFIIIAVLIFSCCFYRSSSKDSPLRTLSTNATCLSTKSLSPLAKSTFDHEWETVSVYSTRSIPRARITHTMPIGPPPTIQHTDTLRSYHHNGYTHPVSRYIGSTLPTPQKSPNFHSPWLESYLHHYPSVNHMHAISYGTLVTANGGGGSSLIPYGSAHNNGVAYSMDTFSNHGHHLVERNKSSSNNINHQKTTQSSKSGKNRQQSQPQQQQRQQYYKSHIDLRSNADSSNGSSSNRMLLSSTSTTNILYEMKDNNENFNNQVSVW
ncbi:leucine rich repeat containing protein 6 [Dermatophagoides farinae]|uniref:Leucine rich repeat containing protein 6 n=1 Tax=Dermatophagoides farinae TaxID=6954 RepID=A0A9D4P897_DERFA|nr:leucine rich repeat containing protein 6 [Dermatophagoides farinae]